MKNLYCGKANLTANVWITGNVNLLYIFPLLPKLKQDARPPFLHGFAADTFSELKLQFQEFSYLLYLILGLYIFKTIILLSQYWFSRGKEINTLDTLNE